MSEPGEATPNAMSLPQLFVRVAASLRSTIPFDQAELVLLDDPARARAFSCNGTERVASRDDYSTRLWLDAARPCEVAELDATRVADRRLLDDGLQTVLSAPLRAGRRDIGLLWLASRTTHAFADAHADILAAVAQLIAVAAEHERQASIERARERRRGKLESLLPVLAEALDVKQVFLGMSPVIREIVPHDIIAYALLSPDRGGVRVQAATHDRVVELGEYRFTAEESKMFDSSWAFLLAYDIEPLADGTVRARVSPRDAPAVEEVIVQPGEQWARFLATAAIRSTLRVPILSQGRPIGGVAFMSRQPDTYDEDAGALAARIADHVALALAHQDLAEEQRRIALAEERALALQARVDVLARELERFSAHRAIGRSPAWQKVLADATQVASTETTVLVTGESGTGKEVVARFLHRGSPRANGPFVALNCAALPEQLLESELFGHERGAFTGALTARAGKLEQATGGVLFLDEVGEMAPAMQAKLLRVLQEREFERLGGAKTLRADVRVIAATNRDPKRAIESGLLREDLYYRLAVFELRLPPLRDRPDDILVLAQAFLDELAASIGRPAAGISDDAREHLLAHAWPGNVRELRNAIERAVILCQGGLVTREHLPMTLVPRVASASAAESIPTEGMPLEAVERDMLQKAMAKAGNNKSAAARLLGLTRGQLYSLLRRHGLTDARR